MNSVKSICLFLMLGFVFPALADQELFLIGDEIVEELQLDAEKEFRGFTHEKPDPPTHHSKPKPKKYHIACYATDSMKTYLSRMTNSTGNFFYLQKRVVRFCRSISSDPNACRPMGCENE